jgi:hypothetical protein
VAEVFEVQIEMWEANPSEVQLDYRAEGKGTSWQPVPEVLATKRTNPDGSRRYTYRVAASRLNLGGQDRFRLRATALDQAGHRTTLERAFRLASGPTLAVGFAPDTGQRAGRDQCRVAVWWTAPAARPVLELRLFAVDLQTQKRRLLATHRPPGNKPTGTFETTVSRPLPTARFLVIASDRAGQFAQAMWSGY